MTEFEFMGRRVYRADQGLYVGDVASLLMYIHDQLVKNNPSPQIPIAYSSWQPLVKDLYRLHPDMVAYKPEGDDDVAIPQQTIYRDRHIRTHWVCYFGEGLYLCRHRLGGFSMRTPTFQDVTTDDLNEATKYKDKPEDKYIPCFMGKNGKWVRLVQEVTNIVQEDA